MNLEKLKQAHEKVKNHPFRLGDKKEWKSYWELLKSLDNEFTYCLEEHFKKNFSLGWGYFIHELRSAIFHFNFEFNDNEDRNKGSVGRLGLKLKEDATPEEKFRYRSYGKIIPEFQKNVVIVIENYIQQIHKFIITETFDEFITYYFGSNIKEGKSRWSKYKFDKNSSKFEFEGELK